MASNKLFSETLICSEKEGKWVCILQFSKKGSETEQWVNHYEKILDFAKFQPFIYTEIST